MITPIVEVGCAAVIVAALLVLVIRGLSHRGVPPASRRLLALGLGLLLLGGLQYSSRHFLPFGRLQQYLDRLQIADILVSREVPLGAKRKIDLWTG